MLGLDLQSAVGDVFRLNPAPAASASMAYVSELTPDCPTPAPSWGKVNDLPAPHCTQDLASNRTN